MTGPKRTSYTVVVTTEGPWYPNHQELADLVENAVDKDTDRNAYPTVEVYDGDLHERLEAEVSARKTCDDDSPKEEAVEVKRPFNADYRVEFVVEAPTLDEMHNLVGEFLKTFAGDIEDSANNWGYVDVEVSVTSSGLLRGSVTARINVEDGDDSST